MKHVNVGLFVVHKGCPHKCSFCDQRSITGAPDELTPEDVKAAAQTALASLDSETAACGEIAFFGGSFTMINRDYMISLLESAYEYVSKGLFGGIRISTRPDGIDDEICRILKSYGVTAVELGAQSMNDRVLALNERGHTAKQVEDACRMLKDFGFETGLQMMTGLYGSDDDDSIETAQKIIALSPDTVRIYPTVVLAGTVLDSLMKSGEYNPPGVEQTVNLCAKLIPMFEKAGLRILRVGLHSGGNVESEYTGGAYHPALGELCEGRVYRNNAESLLASYPEGSYTLAVGGGMASRMAGHKKCNTDYLRQKGYICKIIQDSSLNKYEVKVR
ncbi:MAG: radical SAM protein [Clostridia bacterium]|nr:radical SAM protein [Clostridia bacterium]